MNQSEQRTWDQDNATAQEPEAEETEVGQPESFQVRREFRVERIFDAADYDSASLIAFTFDEFGRIIASVENGPLLLLSSDEPDSPLNKVSVYCDQVTNCQGILALNGSVFVTGDGPDGPALYRLSDKDRNGSGVETNWDGLYPTPVPCRNLFESAQLNRLLTSSDAFVET
ncbi:MAG: hypothetical protein VX346_14690 [Planctomycetota bacterium]|nr:hypothetical protein [Planctomycetota bacterium]